MNADDTELTPEEIAALREFLASPLRRAAWKLEQIIAGATTPEGPAA